MIIMSIYYVFIAYSFLFLIFNYYFHLGSLLNSIILYSLHCIELYFRNFIRASIGERFVTIRFEEEGNFYERHAKSKRSVIVPNIFSAMMSVKSVSRLTGREAIANYRIING